MRKTSALGVLVFPRAARHHRRAFTAVLTALAGGALAIALSASGGGSFTSTVVRTTSLAAITPASPDPSGIAYIPGTGNLIVTDGEVDETVGGITHFAGANVWELTKTGAVVRTTNISPVAPTLLPMTKEPTGIAFNASNGHYYVTDDDAGRVYDLNPGGDGLIGTSDDTFTFFSTLAAGNTNLDPEGIAYVPSVNHLFVSDGFDTEIYEYTTSGALVNHFDTERWGVDDNESVEYNADANTLLVLSNHANRFIAELSLSGALFRTIDISASSVVAAAGLAFAPASDNSGAKRYYVVDRAVDNNTNPSLVDGRLYELTAAPTAAPVGTPPTVNAGADLVVSLPGNGALDATVSDDGTPSPPTTTWSQISGPGTASFGNANAVDTAVTLSLAGVYLLRLTATDGEWTQTDDVVVTAAGAGSTLGVDIPIVANPVGGTTSTDDAEQRGSAAPTSPNGMHLTSADLDMLSDLGTNPLVSMSATGLRFANIPVPKGRPVTNAYVQFTADEASSAATSLTVQAQAIDSAPTFTSSNSNITSRARTTASVAWAPPAWVAVGDALAAERMPNIASVIQEVVNRPGWVAGNALAVIVTGGSTGGRVGRSFDEPKGGRAVLHLEYAATMPNQPPVVAITAPTTPLTITQGTSVAFTGSASDPEQGALTSQLTWRSNLDDQIGTGGAFSTSALTVGTHTITASVTDSGELTGSATVNVTVNPAGPTNQPPVVSAGANQTITLPASASLSGTATDDGLPNPPALLTRTWSKLSGPGTVTFGNASLPATTAGFSLAGTYVLRLTATDTLLTTTSDTTITVNPAGPTNQPPVVSAGANQTITLPASASLSGTATDDGLPNPPALLTRTWSKLSGPGTVTFGNASLPATTAGFSLAGTYVLRLTATDTLLTTTSDTTITVNPAGQTTTLTFGAVADGYVASGAPTTNYGTATALHVKTASGSIKNAFYRFTVAGSAGRTVTSAKLRLHVADASVEGGSVFATASTWTEPTLIWNNQTPPIGSALSTLGPVALGTFVEFSVTPAITGDGTYSFVITSPSGDTVYYGSKESANPPQLVVTLQ